MIKHDDIEQLKKIIAKSEHGIRESSMFLGLYSKNWGDDPVPLLQLALAIVLDKPIAILAIEGAIIPENLKKIAIVTEHAADSSEMHEATSRIMKKMSAA